MNPQPGLGPVVEFGTPAVSGVTRCHVGGDVAGRFVAETVAGVRVQRTDQRAGRAQHGRGAAQAPAQQFVTMIGEQRQAVVAGELQGQVDQGRGGATVGRGVL